MKQSRYLTAREAAEVLDVSVATIYAYVSRGLIRSEPAGLNQRARLYVAEDVQKLLEQKPYRHEPAKAANTAWPVLSRYGRYTIGNDTHH